jgi:hypothetical protein
LATPLSTPTGKDSQSLLSSQVSTRPLATRGCHDARCLQALGP